MRIFEVGSRAEFKRAFPVMQELRPHLNEASYLTLLDEMIPAGYRLLARQD